MKPAPSGWTARYSTNGGVDFPENTTGIPIVGWENGDAMVENPYPKMVRARDVRMRGLGKYVGNIYERGKSRQWFGHMNEWPDSAIESLESLAPRLSVLLAQAVTEIPNPPESLIKALEMARHLQEYVEII